MVIALLQRGEVNLTRWLALCPLSRSAGTKQTTTAKPLAAQQSSERPSPVQAVD
ncbi:MULTISPECIES: hypothetical protein [Thermoleptolyngbya]|uniref:hypothetical protein n=1 Tax=Thermoleptolyngbya TaxID=2303528 RepID=UPI001964A22E|nr:MULTISPECIES: hypothetical protein [Thermoleptolyngbya]